MSGARRKSPGCLLRRRSWADRTIAQYDYTPLIRLLVLTGIRVSEALALRWQDIDLLEATIHVRHSWSREGTLTEPKTKAAGGTVPIAPGIVDMLVTMKPEDANEDTFVFSTTGTTPISYHNFRNRGFVPAVMKGDLRARASRSTVSGPRRSRCTRHADSRCWRRRRSWGRLTPVSPGSTTRACSTAPTWKPASVPRRHRLVGSHQHLPYPVRRAGQVARECSGVTPGASEVVDIPATVALALPDAPEAREVLVRSDSFPARLSDVRARGR